MPIRKVIDANGQTSIETFEYTQDELDAQAARRQAHADKKAADAQDKAALSDRLSELKANENSMPALKEKVNYLLKEVARLKGLRARAARRERP